MLNPIYQDDQLICPRCACVLREFVEPQPQYTEQASTTSTADMLLLGSAVERAVTPSFMRAIKHDYEERVLRQLIAVTKKFGLPESFAISTFNQLKRDKSGFRSELQPIKQLLKILSKDENYIHNQKMRAIKQAYEISSM